MAVLPHMKVFVRGKCAVCGGSAERWHTVYGHTVSELRVNEAARRAAPVVHKRCEP